MAFLRGSSFLCGDPGEGWGGDRVADLFLDRAQGLDLQKRAAHDAGLGVRHGDRRALLVSSHSNLALFVVLLLPSIYYLVVPTSLRWTVIAGATCSILLLGGYLLPVQASPTDTGLVIAVITLNLALLLVVTRSNRLQRTEWLATQAERAAKEELITSRAMFERCSKRSRLPLVVTRLDGTLVTTNDASIRFFGLAPETMRIQSISEVYANPQDRNAILDRLTSEGQITGLPDDRTRG